MASDLELRIVQLCSRSKCADSSRNWLKKRKEVSVQSSVCLSQVLERCDNCFRCFLFFRRIGPKLGTLPLPLFLFYFLFSCIFILLSRESDQCAIRARLGVAGHLSTTPRWGNPAKCLSQRHNKQTCRLVLHTVPSVLNVKQGSCEYQC